MEKNVAIIDIEVYNNLKLFHTKMMEGEVGITYNYNTTYYVSKDKFHEDILAEVIRLKKQIEILEKENSKLKKEIKNPRKLNWVQRLFD